MESVEIMLPLITNSDAATAVIGMRLVFWIGTTLNYARPNFIECTVTQAVSGVVAHGNFFLQATAGFGLAAKKICRQHIAGVSAIAQAFPLDIPTGVPGDRAKRDKATKSLARDVFCVFGKGDKLGMHQKLSFLVSCQERFAVAAWYFYEVFASLIIPRCKREEHIAQTI